MRLLDRIRERWQRAFGDEDFGRPPAAAEDAPARTMPSSDAPPVPCGWNAAGDPLVRDAAGVRPATAGEMAAPHGIATAETLAAIVARAQAEAGAAHGAAGAGQPGTRDEPAAPAPLAPAAHEPPPMPPSELSRVMVSQIPSPPANDRNFDWTHRYADYMRRVGVATGTATDLEHTMAWGVPALEPGDGSGVAL